MGIELERHPPERGTLPVVVAGGCCTTCCCCCCCCAYVVGGLAGAAIGSAIASTDGAEARKAVGKYWTVIGIALCAALVLGLMGFAFAGFWVVAGVLLLALPVFQALASLVMFVNGDPVARRAALKVTVWWLLLTVVGTLLTAAMFAKCVDVKP